MADQGGNTNTVLIRDYRKGNWTVSETMVLIEAKKMDDERRMKRSSDSAAEGGIRSSKPAELRWKWVEDYCWKKGCLRSQNQCNDKWDNLMRDYKKVREYERRVSERTREGISHDGFLVSYWNLEKNERKDKNLPSNMLVQIYEALVEVVERRGLSSSSSSGQRMVNIPAHGASASSNINPNLITSDHHQMVVVQPPSLPPPPVIHPLQLPPPPPPPQAQQSLPTMVISSDSEDTSEHSDSAAKRRRRGDDDEEGNANISEVGNAISKSATIIAEAIQACEEREERRHKELLSLHERRLKIEESKTEINRQGINGLVDAINKLANSILALASSHNTKT